eukprot:TRINITY_DN33504_c0_g1_i1.p1 TRINITY_DN33504_c0_g1~~TRINITY_DN33504_c0_g1_i1.p1  ORF type:complete len:681 (+),score=201.64 TRINITY_DN33504_c0_g1_i1:37-2079(+)
MRESNMSRDVLDLGFLPKQTTGVAAMAMNKAKNKLAVCRVNGAMEMWEVDKKTRPYLWREQATEGRRNMTVRDIVWLGENRILTCTLGGQLIEYNTALEITSVTSSHGGPVWGMDYCRALGVVAIACEDARVRFFEVADSLTLLPKYTTMVRPDADRVLCVKFNANGSRVYYGDNNGCLACAQWKDSATVWDTEMSTRLATFKPRQQASKPTPAMAWSILEVNNSVLAVTSTGEVKVLDPFTGVLLQSIRSHKADLLSICQVDDIVFTTGVDNNLATFKQWEGEWVKSEGRNWSRCDITSLTPGGNGLLLTGSLDGCIGVCETRKMFPAKCATAKGSVFHTDLPYHHHIYPYKSHSRVVAVEDHAITIHAIPDADAKQEIVALLRYEIEGDAAVKRFVVHNDGKCMVFSTGERTCVVGLDDDEATLIEEWDRLPAATGLCFDGDTLLLTYEGGIKVIQDVADGPGATVLDIPDAVTGATNGKLKDGVAVVCSKHDATQGMLTMYGPVKESKGKKRTSLPGTMVKLCTKKMNRQVKDMAMCSVKGVPVVFVLLVDGTTGAYEATTGKAVWGRENMPNMSSFSKVKWISGCENYVVLSSNDWFTVIDLTTPKYTEVKATRFYDHVKGKKSKPASASTLPVFYHFVQGALITDAGKSLLVNTYSADKSFLSIPPCFWRKEYGT